MADEDLNAKVLKAAQAQVGNAALMRTGYGTDCFVLVDKILRDLGAATAADGDVKVTPTADYDWGDGITFDSIQPGDILQFNRHFIKIVTVTKGPSGTVTKTATLSRPHHTAIVVSYNKQTGSAVVIEQNVHPNPDKVNQNTIPRLEAGEVKTKRDVGDDEVRTTMTVSGEVKAYRPTEKPPKSTSLTPSSGGSRTMAFIAPSQGARRLPGPIGMQDPASRDKA